MEFVDGLTLRQLLDAGKLAPQEALAIVPQICEALQFAHDKGVVHRDIKPENILMDRSGQVKIADFGLAKLVGQEGKDFTITGAGQVMGTPNYMAPEQIEHPQDVDHRADIYSLGVVFYQMLTGELPIGRFAPPSKKVQIDVRLDEVVLRALEKEPQQRYQQASDLKTEVETITQTKSEASRPKTASRLERAFPELGDWARLFRNKWMTAVGTRHGERVVNWPAVLFLSTAIAGVIASFLLLPYSIPFLLGRNPKENPLQILVAELIAVAAAAIIMRSFIRWKLTLPTSKLPPLNSVAAREHATAVADVSPAAANENARLQARGPAVGPLVSTLPAPNAAPPRLSKTALVGAVWGGPLFAIIILSLCVITLWLTLSLDSLFPLLSPILILLLATPIGVPILGLVALKQIRRSAGRLYGLGLAVFDLLAFPLLALERRDRRAWHFCSEGLGKLLEQRCWDIRRTCFSGRRHAYRCRVCRHRLPHHPLGLARGESAARWRAPGRPAQAGRAEDHAIGCRTGGGVCSWCFWLCFSSVFADGTLGKRAGPHPHVHF